jgi:hypothetical protein
MLALCKFYANLTHSRDQHSLTLPADPGAQCLCVTGRGPWTDLWGDPGGPSPSPLGAATCGLMAWEEEAGSHVGELSLDLVTEAVPSMVAAGDRAVSSSAVPQGPVAPEMLPVFAIAA